MLYEASKLEPLGAKSQASSFSVDNYKKAESAILQYKTFKCGIDEAKVARFKADVILKSEVSSLEFMYICLREIRKSSVKVLESIFDQNGEVGHTIFVLWFNSVPSIVGEKRTRAQTLSSDSESEGIFFYEMLIMICYFFVIHETNNIKLLKTKFRKVWLDIATKVRSFVSVCTIFAETIFVGI